MILDMSTFMLGMLSGGMLYVTILVAPIIFIVLDDPEATLFTRQLWPKYFIINGFLSFVLAITLTVATDWLVSGLFVFVVAILMMINWLCAKKMQTMRDPGSDYVEGSTYDWLHSFTVWTNALSIILFIGVEFTFLWARYYA